MNRIKINLIFRCEKICKIPYELNDALKIKPFSVPSILYIYFFYDFPHSETILTYQLYQNPYLA